MKKKVLITGSGAPGWYGTYLLAKDCLPDSYIYGCDQRQQTSGKSFCDEHFVLPIGTDVSYVDKISEKISEHGLSLVLPLTDPELVPLSTLQIDGCFVPVSETAALDIVLNKESLYETLPSISPKFEKSKGFESVENFINDKSDGKSCYVKIPSAYGSRGTKKVITDKEWLDKFATAKPDQYGTLFPISQLDGIKEHVILVETLPGEEYSVDCVFDENSKLVFYAVRERFKIKNGICDTAKFVVDESAEFRDILEEISQAVKLKYNINVQMRRDVHGKLKLLEINPRISGSLGAFNMVGYNLIDMTLKILNGKNISVPYDTPQTYKHDYSYRVSFFGAT